MLSSIISQASHVLGGEVTWRCTGNGQYRFKVTIYRDCSGISFTENTVTLATTIPGATNVICNLISTSDVSPICVQTTPGVGQLGCGANPATGNGPNGSIARFIYESGNVNLSAAPAPPAAGYAMWTTSIPCCRNTNNNTNCGGDMILRARMYPYTPPGAAAPLGLGAMCDNGPDFYEPPTALAIAAANSQDTLDFNNNAIDRDQDNLSYFIDVPITDVNGNPPTFTECNYNVPTGSANFPFPGVVRTFGFPDPTLNNLPINKLTGAISFRVVDNQLRRYLTCIRVESWRCGQKIAEVFRDFQLQVIQVTGAPAGQRRPDLDRPFRGNCSSDNGYTITTFAGDTVKFTIQASDFAPVFPAQNVSVFFNGLIFGTNYNSYTTGCPNPPCAIVTNPQGDPPSPIVVRGEIEGYGYTGQYGSAASFVWPTACNHYINNGCGQLSNIYTFTATAKDDYCPANGRTIGIIKVIVVRPPVWETPKITCVATTDSGDVKLSWELPIDSVKLGCDTTVQQSINRKIDTFTKYLIYRADTATGPFVFIDSVTSALATSWTDTSVDVRRGSRYYYRMTVVSGCQDDTAAFTPVVSPMLLTAQYDAGIGAVKLDWNYLAAPAPFLPNHVANYTLVRENVTIAPGVWDTVATGLLDTLYDDPALFCNDILRYRILVKDTATDCFSISTTAFDTALDDQAPAKVLLYQISVDTTSNQLFAKFEPSTSLDTRGYIIYKVISQNGVFVGQPIDTILGRMNNIATIPFDDPQTGIFNYGIAAFDSCGNLGLRSDQNNNVLLNVIEDRCNSRLVVNWTRANNWTAGIRDFTLYRSENNGPWTQLGVYTPIQDTFYFDTNIINGNRYAYGVVAVSNQADSITSFSNMQIRTGNVVILPQFLHVRYATVDSITKSVKLAVIIDSLADASRYELYRSPVDSFNFTLIDTLNIAQSTLLNGYRQLFFTDNDAKTDERSYFYKVEAINICGNKFFTSDTVRTMFLSGTDNLNFTNEMRWNTYEKWPGGTIRNYMFRRVEGVEQDFSFLTALTNTDTAYDDDVQNLTNSNGVFCYYLLAVEAGPNSYNYVDSAVSNIVCVTQPPRMFKPTAFVPDGLNNVFRPVGVFVDDVNPGSYSMKVFNRWGEQIFETNKFTEGWNGQVNGKVAQEGVYIYYIEFMGRNGLPYSQKGTVTLLR